MHTRFKHQKNAISVGVPVLVHFIWLFFHEQTIQLTQTLTVYYDRPLFDSSSTFQIFLNVQQKTRDNSEKKKSVESWEACENILVLFVCVRLCPVYKRTFNMVQWIWKRWKWMLLIFTVSQSHVVQQSTLLSICLPYFHS